MQTLSPAHTERSEAKLACTVSMLGMGAVTRVKAALGVVNFARGKGP